MKTPLNFATREQAERWGQAEAERLTKRGYPTHVMGIARRIVRTEIRSYSMGNVASDWAMETIESERWEALLSD